MWCVVERQTRDKIATHSYQVILCHQWLRLLLPWQHGYCAEPCGCPSRPRQPWLWERMVRSPEHHRKLVTEGGWRGYHLRARETTTRKERQRAAWRHTSWLGRLCDQRPRLPRHLRQCRPHRTVKSRMPRPLGWSCVRQVERRGHSTATRTGKCSRQTWRRTGKAQTPQRRESAVPTRKSLLARCLLLSRLCVANRTCN